MDSLDFKSSNGQVMSVVGSIPMHSRHFFIQKNLDRGDSLSLNL